MGSIAPMSVIVHGGAGRFREERAARKIPKMRESVDAAWRVLQEGAPGDVAVAAALRVMEESEHFNAGFGGYPNAQGIVLLDAAVMRGTREFVAFMNCRRIKYPATYALDMLQQGNSYVSLWTHERMQELDQASPERKARYGWVATHQELLPSSVEEMLQRDEGEFSVDGSTHGTVGCVVSDGQGRLFSGISTGGTNWKMNGRIGDAPMIGLGLYADDDLCAFTTTGNGEALLAAFPTGFIIGAVRDALREDPNVFQSGERIQQIIDREFDELDRKTAPKGGGIIMIPRGGLPVYSFNTEALPLGIRVANGERVVRDEVFIARRNAAPFFG